MKYITDITTLRLNNTVVTIGKFDGNHAGHRYLFDTVVALKEYAMDAVILTFSSGVKQPDVQKQSILTNLEKQQFDYPEGIDYVIECPFTDELKHMYPEEFIEKILVKKLGVKKIVVGNDFRFGVNRSGDIRTLYDLSERFKYELYAMEKIKYDGVDISSTYIREKILEGDMEAAKDMLMEPFSVTGEVVRGKQIGRTIGFPTINFDVPENKILPPNGGYITKTVVDGVSYQSITNIGFRPTIGDNEIKTIETHILDFNDDLYGKTVKVEFYKYLRPEQKFACLEALQAAIEENINDVRDYFEDADAPDGDDR